MIRLILVVVMLFSFTVEAENLKYKRNNYDNMIMHMKCYHMADLLGLVQGRVDLHFAEHYRYAPLAWKGMTLEIKDSYSGESDFTVQQFKYTKGFINGVYVGMYEDKDKINTIYMATCQDDNLVFMTTGK